MANLEVVDINNSVAQSDLSELSKIWRKMFTKQATVSRSEQVADRFYLLTLESSSFKGRSWVAGQKVQIAMGSGFMTRTYTPIDWNPTTGVTHILGYAHGKGYGNDWLRNVKSGDKCNLFGPNTSLDLNRVLESIVVIGDETSIGLACALQRTLDNVRIILEVDTVENVQKVVERLQLSNVQLQPRSKDGDYLIEIERELQTLAENGSSFVLTGNAQSIQHVRRSLKSLNVASKRIFTKAYWAEGKTGID